MDIPTPLPAETQRQIDVMTEAAQGGPSIADSTPAEVRRFYNKFWERLSHGGPSEISAKPVMLDTTAGRVPARLYNADGATPKPVIVLIHGGGWMLLSLDTHERLCRVVARESGFAVLSLDYPLAPENPYPAGLNACVAVIAWLAQNGRNLNLDGSRIGVMGDSSGGNIALAALIRCRDAKIATRAGLLVYGAYDDDMDTPSHRAYGGGNLPLTTREVAWFLDHYAPAAKGSRTAEVRPLRADLNGLPPLYVAASEFDCIRSDSENLVECLAAIGAPHRFSLWRGMLHGSLMMDEHAPSMSGHIRALCAAAREWMV